MSSESRLRIFIQPTLCEKCAHTFECIWTSLKLEPVYKSLLFFILRGCLVPNLDDSMYFILVQEYRRSQEHYDILIIAQSVGIFLTAIFYYIFLRKE